MEVTATISFGPGVTEDTTKGVQGGPAHPLVPGWLPDLPPAARAAAPHGQDPVLLQIPEQQQLAGLSQRHQPTPLRACPPPPLEPIPKHPAPLPQRQRRSRIGSIQRTHHSQVRVVGPTRDSRPSGVLLRQQAGAMGRRSSVKPKNFPASL